MNVRTGFLAFAGIAAAACVFAACGGGGSTGSGPVPIAQASPPVTPTPPATLLYADHFGVLDEYALPLHAGSKPLRRIVEAPGAALPPQVAVDPYGRIAVATPTELRIFDPPIRSLAPQRAKLRLTLTPAITEMGPAGADLVDIEYDPNDDLWLLNDLGGDVSEIRAPVSRNSVAALTIGFGAPGSKTAGYSALIQARFDVNGALYVYANQANTTRSRIFKTGFPYAKPPSPVGIDLAQADFVDASQYLPTSPYQAPLALGQYFGALASPLPGSPPPLPVNVLAQFAQPFNPVLGLFPEATADTIVGALIADPPRRSFYTLDAATGSLQQYVIPMSQHAKPSFSLPCTGGPSLCNAKPQHLFLAP